MTGSLCPTAEINTTLWIDYILIKKRKIILFYLGPHVQHIKSSWARGRIGPAAAGLHHSHSKCRLLIWAASVTYAASASDTATCGNAGSLAHWSRSGIEPKTSWFLVIFISAVPWWELQKILFWLWIILFQNHKTISKTNMFHNTKTVNH